jgi:hypothetical protein
MLRGCVLTNHVLIAAVYLVPSRTLVPGHTWFEGAPSTVALSPPEALMAAIRRHTTAKKVGDATLAMASLVSVTASSSLYSYRRTT